MEAVREQKFLVAEGSLPFSAFINRDVHVRFHWHTYLELLYVVCGEAVITVDTQLYRVTPGDFVMVNSQEAHACEELENSHAEILVIQFEPSVLSLTPGSLVESTYILPFSEKGVDYTRIIRLKEDSPLQALMTDILEEFAGKLPGYELNVRGNIYKSFSWLIRNGYVRLPKGGDLEKQEVLRLEQLFEYIGAHFRKEISNQEAAHIACMSYHYFCRYFKQVTGRTFVEYLNHIRLREAQRLLLTTKRSMQEIAQNCGFRSTSYFSRIFKKEKQISPLAYRKQNCAKNSHTKAFSSEKDTV